MMEQMPKISDHQQSLWSLICIKNFGWFRDTFCRLLLNLAKFRNIFGVTFVSNLSVNLSPSSFFYGMVTVGAASCRDTAICRMEKAFDRYVII